MSKLNVTSLSRTEITVQSQGHILTYTTLDDGKDVLVCFDCHSTACICWYV